MSEQTLPKNASQSVTAWYPGSFPLQHTSHGLGVHLQLCSATVSKSPLLGYKHSILFSLGERMVTDSACDSLEDIHHTALHCYFHYLHITTKKIAENAWVSLWNISVPTSRTTSLFPALQYPCRPNAIISPQPLHSLCLFFPSQGCRERHEAILECLLCGMKCSGFFRHFYEDNSI